MVTVALGGAFARTDLIFSPTTLMFASDRWFLPQVVTITAPQDFVDEGVFYFDALRANASCTDDGGSCAEFDGISAKIMVRVIDDDQAGIVVGGDPVRIFVDAAGDCYTNGQHTIRLTSKPRHNVTLSVSPGSEYLSPSPSTLTFTPEHWNTTRRVKVCARSPDVTAFESILNYLVQSNDQWYDDSGALRIAAAAQGDGFTTPNVTVHVKIRGDGLPAPLMRSAQLFNTGAGVTVTFNEVRLCTIADSLHDFLRQRS